MQDRICKATDSDGREVVFDARSKGHLIRRRPQMIGHMAAVLDAVTRPDVREDDFAAT